MRFAVALTLENEFIPKDKNRLILSFMKKAFKEYDQDYFNELYSSPKRKDFTFSLYLGDCMFLDKRILIPEKRIILNFSSYNFQDGVMFYNAMLKQRFNPYKIANNSITATNINMVREKPVNSNVFKILSPILVREHNNNNKETRYHSLKTDKGVEVFRKNLEYQLIDSLGEKVVYDFKDIKIEPYTKDVHVIHYSTPLLANIGYIKIKAPDYILNYLVKAGVGAKKSSGFGMLEEVR